MNKTQIEWVKNPDGTQGYTWNPITGCLNGCPYCYARKLANGRLRERYLANPNIAPVSYPLPDIPASLQPFYPRFWKDRLYHAWGGEPKGIFVCDMSDLFGIGIPEEWTEKVLSLCRLHSENRYYLLTKQPQNLIKFSPFPDNCWVGVTATGREAWRVAQGKLDFIKAKVKYISCEPLLEPVGISPYDLSGYGGSVDWVIIGSQTKPYKPPEISRVEEIVRAADRAGIAVFLKDNLRTLILDSLAKHQIDRDRYLKNGLLRQEVPGVTPEG